MLRWTRKQGVEVGIFCALHTYGRQFNQHPHVHGSVQKPSVRKPAALQQCTGWQTRHRISGRKAA
ncbi:TPA: transposase [Vibrio cholerae]|nr:transposase [Vibrio cholerae]